MAKALAVFGTGTNTGKSVITTALCRILSNKKYRVAPFKAQNMSNNSLVVSGGEIGYAQAEQALAARAVPSVNMNPILLKPHRDIESQVIIHGQVWKNFLAVDYWRTKNLEEVYKLAVTPSIRKLLSDYEVLVIEGAGSCAEINLFDTDITNWRIADEANASVIIVGDIDKCGIFAQLIGTYNLLREPMKRRVKGFIVNKFRGDINLFTEGVNMIEAYTGVPVLGVVPMYKDILIGAEDSLPPGSLIDPPLKPLPRDKINIAVVLLPHVSNLTDFEPLLIEPQANVHFLSVPRALHGYNAVLLPGSKNVISDMEWINNSTWKHYITDYTQENTSHGIVGGICGGYQILSKTITDYSMEGSPTVNGLGIFNAVTTIHKNKILHQNVKVIWLPFNTHTEGYEIHMGLTVHNNSHFSPLLALADSTNGKSLSCTGAINRTGKIWGMYLHGIFNTTSFRKIFLHHLRPDLVKMELSREDNYISWKDVEFEKLANHFEKHLNMSKVMDLIK